MFNRIFEAVIVLIFAAIIASSIVSLSLLLIPNVAGTFLCPDGGKLALSNYSQFALTGKQGGIFFECFDENGVGGRYAHNYLLGYTEFVAIITAVLAAPMYFLFRRILTGPRPLVANKKKTGIKHIPAGQTR